MTFFKKTVLPVLIILFAASLVVLIALPLQETGFADGLRLETVESTELTESPAESNTMPAALMFIAVSLGSLIKVALFMGVGGLLTTAGLWLRQRFSKKPKRSSVKM